MAHKRLHVLYSGSVQGVGFRFTAVDVANELGLTGWVRNMRDGGVEAVCEGEEEMLKEFLKKVRSSMRGYIHKENASWSEATGEFKNFGIAP